MASLNTMIARIWRAAATPAGAAAYAKHFHDSVRPSLLGLDGYRHAYLLNRSDSDDFVEIQVITLWESLDSIRAFTGDDRELTAAVVEPAAQAVLTSFDTTADHYEVLD
jgi:heme-degrading monooxygenase HmoA